MGKPSSDDEQPVQKIAAGSAQRHWRGMGARDVMEAKSILIARARKWLGVEAVRGHAMLKLDRLLRQVVGGNLILTMRKDVGVRGVLHGGRGDKRIIGTVESTGGEVDPA